MYKTIQTTLYVRNCEITCTYIHVHAPGKMNYYYIRIAILCICLFVCIKTERMGGKMSNVVFPSIVIF